MAVDWERCYKELSETLDPLQRDAEKLFSSNRMQCAIRIESRPPRICVSYPALDERDERISRIALGISEIATVYDLQVSGFGGHGKGFYLLKPRYKKFERATPGPVASRSRSYS